MLLRSLAALMLVLLLWGCNVPVKPNDAAIQEIERRHEETTRMLGGGGGGSGM